MPKLVLFDIDETMIKSDGAGRRALERALTETFGLSQELPCINMSGKTDPQICQEMLLQLGFAAEHIYNNLPDTFGIYTKYLQEEVIRSSGFRLHNGVTALLESLSNNSAVHLGLLTGNIEPGARIKLQPFELNHYFAIGAFGSDSANRLELPAVAAQRAKEHFGITFAPEEMVIIGDAVNDIACAKGYGATSIAVHTGRTSREELQVLEPDHLFPTLEDTELLLKAILS